MTDLELVIRLNQENTSIDKFCLDWELDPRKVKKITRDNLFAFATVRRYKTYDSLPRFARELIEDAITNQDIETSLLSCIEDLLGESVLWCMDEIAEYLHDLYIKKHYDR